MLLKLASSVAMASTVFALLLPASADAATRVFQASGATIGGIRTTVERYRNALGTLNPNEPGSRGSGRREINWDGVPDEFSDPTRFPGNFFNANLSGRARGVLFTSPGGFLVSADAENATNTPVRFGRLNPTNPSNFRAFSNERIFSALATQGGNSNVVTVNFRIPGRNTPAVTNGFGVVFTDVEVAGSAKVEYFDREGRVLRQVTAKTSPNFGLSFVGVIFDNPVVARVRITSGNVRLGMSDNTADGRDVVVMDDFIYGEPVPLP